MNDQELQTAIDRSTGVLRNGYDHCFEYQKHKEHLIELLKIQLARAQIQPRKRNRSKAQPTA
jgi:hypothetical protein